MWNMEAIQKSAEVKTISVSSKQNLQTSNPLSIIKYNKLVRVVFISIFTFPLLNNKSKVFSKFQIPLYNILIL